MARATSEDLDRKDSCRSESFDELQINGRLKLTLESAIGKIDLGLRRFHHCIRRKMQTSMYNTEAIKTIMAMKIPNKTEQK